MDIYKNLKKIQKKKSKINKNKIKKITKWHVAHYWVDTCAFKKNKKNHEVTRGNHCSWPLMI